MQLSTYERWNVLEVGYKADMIDGQQMLRSVWCCVCSEQITKICPDSRICGQEKKDAQI